MNAMLFQAAYNSKPTHGNMNARVSCMCRYSKPVPQVSCADCAVVYPRSILLLGLSSTLPVALFQACRGWIFFLDCQIIMLLVCDSLMLLRCGAYVSIPIASCLWDGVNLIDEMLNDLLWLIRIRIYMYLCCVSWQLCKRKLHTVQNLRISLLLAWLYVYRSAPHLPVFLAVIVIG